MDQLWFYFDMGLWHVLDAAAIDHLLFIAAFTVPYHFEALRKLLWWTTLFTVGHTLSLIGNYYFALNPPTEWVEFLPREMNDPSLYGLIGEFVDNN